MNFLLDVQPTILRSRASRTLDDGRHVAMTVVPKQVVLVFGAGQPPRTLLGEESMILQGFPVAKIPALVNAHHQHFLMDLAGNAVSLPVLLALMMSTISAVSWRHTTLNDVSHDSDIAVALAAFDVLPSVSSRAGEEGPQHASPPRRCHQRT